MQVDPTVTCEDLTGAFVILAAINPGDKKPYPLTINPVTGELIVDAELTGDVIVDIDLPEDMEYFDTITLTDGLAHALPAQALKDGVILKTDPANAADFRIGGSTVSGTKGIPLEPGESMKIRVEDGQKVYYIGTIGDILHYIGG